MQDTAAEERGRQRRDLDFPGECSVGLNLRKQKENTAIAAVRIQPPGPSLVLSSCLIMLMCREEERSQRC